ncbi:hypothetical protein TSH100_08445 [Azospirillum sp. TSH100]|uniref:hypothetical protein n=1 Tax=Azospirillum sp. TSH100 TaxID=652764 RepID=UPI000D62095A|nr:hypothetical protein [Azospirillum sp. TSH100]PWC88099.1 hypothetical protein TSH100_08445 [Azospirillum sp. TSH100]QCG92153.1 hypothetical protein E6C72_30660 [Azospirillum sp. TSH100]
MSGESCPPPSSPQDHVQTGLLRRLAAGIGAQGAAQVVLILGNLLSVPGFLAAWGGGVFADWLVLSAAAALLTLADFGISGYLGNTLRAAWASGDEVGGRRILQIGLGIYGVLCAAVAAAVVAASILADMPALLGVTRLEGAGPTQLILALTIVILLPRGLIAAVHSARGRFHREVLLLMLTQAGQVTAGVAVALAGGGPQTAATAQLAAALLLGWGALLWDLYRHGDLHALRPQTPDGRELRRLAIKAPLYAMQTGAVMALVHLPILLLGRLAPASAVVTFATIRTFVGLVRQTARQVATPLGLEMARMHAGGNRAAAGRLYADSVAPTGCIVALLAGGAWSAGPAILTLWTHGTAVFDPLTAGALLAGALIQVPAYGAGALLRLVDRPGTIAAIHAVEILAILLLGLLLIPTAGAAGAALTVILAETIPAIPWYLHSTGRLLGCRILRPVLRAYAVTGAVFLLVLLTAAAINQLVSLDTVPGLGVFMLLWAATAPPALIVTLSTGQRNWIRLRLHGYRRRLSAKD